MNFNPIKIGSSLPDFNLPGVDGSFHSNYKYSDKKLLLVIFSCNHCPYVQAYEKRMIDIQNDYGDKGLQIIAINSNDAVNYPEDSFDEMKKRSEKIGFNFPYLYDESQEVARRFGATHTPQLFLFDGERKLAYTGKIDDNWKEPEKVKVRYLRDALNELIEEKQVSVPETFAIGCTIKWK